MIGYDSIHKVVKERVDENDFIIKTIGAKCKHCSFECDGHTRNDTIPWMRAEVKR